MGTIRNGKYYPDDHVKPVQAIPTVASIADEGALRGMAQEHAHELIQPHQADGTPNQDFVDYFPEAAKDYGFIKD